MTPEAAAPKPTPKPPASLRRNRTLAELAAEQGITGPQDFDALFGAGADLWNNDADFDAFQTALQESRRPATDRFLGRDGEPSRVSGRVLADAVVRAGHARRA